MTKTYTIVFTDNTVQQIGGVADTIEDQYSIMLRGLAGATQVAINTGQIKMVVITDEAEEQSDLVLPGQQRQQEAEAAPYTPDPQPVSSAEAASE